MNIPLHRAVTLAALLIATIFASPARGQSQTIDATTREHLALTVHATHALLLAGTGDCEAARYAAPLCEEVLTRVTVLASHYDATRAHRAHEPGEGRAFLPPTVTTFGGDLLPLAAACHQYLEIHRDGRGPISPSLDGLVLYSDTGRVTAGGALAHALEVEQRCRPRATPTAAPTPPPAPAAPTPSRWGMSVAARTWVPLMVPTTAFFPALPQLALGPTLRLGPITLGLRATVGAMRSTTALNANTTAPQWAIAAGADLRATWTLPLHPRVGVTLGAHAAWSYMHRRIERPSGLTTQHTHLAQIGAVVGVSFSLHRAVSLALACDADWVPVAANGALHHTMQLVPELAVNVHF